MIGANTGQTIGDDHPIDHVGQDRRPRAPLKGNSNYRALGSPTNRSTDVGTFGWRSERRRNHTTQARPSSDLSARTGKTKGRRLHTNIFAPGYDSER